VHFTERTEQAVARIGALQRLTHAGCGMRLCGDAGTGCSKLALIEQKMADLVAMH